MAETQVMRTYSKAEFTSTINPNPRVLRREIAAENLSIPPSNVNKSGTDIILGWTGLDGYLPTTDDMAIIDGVVASHTGGNTAAISVSKENEQIDFNATDIWDIKLLLTTDRLTAGTYEVVWYSEIAADAVVDNSGAAIQIVIQGEVEFSDRQAETEWFPVSGTNFVDVLEGDTIQIAIRYRKVGPAANIAKIQKTRASIKPLAS